MPHAVHCQGTKGNSAQALVKFTVTAQGFNEQDSKQASSELLRILSKYRTSMIGGIDNDTIQADFTDKEEVVKAVKELKVANLGIAVTVTGVDEQEYSVGVRGKLSKLPEAEILEITTMCGHGMVSQHLARQTLLDMKRGILSPRQAAEHLATPCICGVFNPKRAQRLLEELTEIWYYDEF
ncbi:hypothetical protein [Desulfosporosinus lacus]|uniref:Uncharacterized protein n=1 Tax=Desulfosporosinus lacus DSM 15449 TaxID=1121420 RepID=A0A1M5ZMT0_9FIRM|nr:hypothetical protein [Desulfosporosinus lacus]SHI25494.1 hypothetical protein SAMN02746098_03429 [Desulfosporosinus lacus DSM 15449]